MICFIFFFIIFFFIASLPTEFYCNRIFQFFNRIAESVWMCFALYLILIHLQCDSSSLSGAECSLCYILSLGRAGGQASRLLYLQIIHFPNEPKSNEWMPKVKRSHSILEKIEWLEIHVGNNSKIHQTAQTTNQPTESFSIYFLNDFMKTMNSFKASAINDLLKQMILLWKFVKFYMVVYNANESQTHTYTDTTNHNPVFLEMVFNYCTLCKIWRNTLIEAAFIRHCYFWYVIWWWLAKVMKRWHSQCEPRSLHSLSLSQNNDILWFMLATVILVIL